jgi:hypothetical protein
VRRYRFVTPPNLLAAHDARYVAALEAVVDLARRDHGPGRELAFEDHTRCDVCAAIAAADAFLAPSPAPVIGGEESER